MKSAKSTPHDGPHKERLADGGISGEGRVNDGKRQGKWAWFYKNGTLKAVGEYANGQLWDEGNYEGGKKVDEWKVYHQNSELKQTKVFKRKE